MQTEERKQERPGNKANAPACRIVAVFYCQHMLLVLTIKPIIGGLKYHTPSLNNCPEKYLQKKHGGMSLLFI